jgi:hypothetical protein
VNTSELNKVLSDEIHKLRSGKAKPERVNAVTRAASQIIAAARLELAYVKMAGVPQAALPFFSHHGKGRVIQEPKKLK